MKEKLKAALLVGALALPLWAHAGYIDQVALVSPPPQAGQMVAVKVDGHLPSPLYNFVQPAQVNVMDWHIFVDLFADDTSGGSMMGAAVMTPYMTTVNLGMFDARQYMLHTRLNIGGQMKEEHISYFDVASGISGGGHQHAVALPATLSLLLAGALSLVWARRR